MSIFSPSATLGGTRFPSPPAPGSRPAWSPDGQKIAYSDNQSGSYDIYTMDASNGDDKEVFVSGPSTQVSPNWSLDGGWIAYSDGFSSMTAAST